MRPAGRPESRRRSAPAAPAGHAVHRHVRLAAPAGADDDSAGPSRTGPPAVSPRGAPGRVPAAAARSRVAAARSRVAAARSRVAVGPARVAVGPARVRDESGRDRSVASRGSVRPGRSRLLRPTDAFRAASVGTPRCERFPARLRLTAHARASGRSSTHTRLGHPSVSRSRSSRRGCPA